MTPIKAIITRAIQSGNLVPGLNLGAKSLVLTLAAGVGSAPIPNTAHRVGLRPAAGAAVRVGLEAPEADGTATGNAAAADFKKGIPLVAEQWALFDLIPASQTLYFKGGAADVIAVYFV